jgi:hypothetical protein
MRGSFNTPHWNWLDYTITTTISGWWWLEPWNFEWLFHSVGNVIVPTDELTPSFFQRGRWLNHQPATTISLRRGSTPLGPRVVATGSVVSWGDLRGPDHVRCCELIYSNLHLVTGLNGICVFLVLSSNYESIHLFIFLSIHISIF